MGFEGSTGNSTGVHLHLELRQPPYFTNNRVDITKYLGIENKIGNVPDIGIKTDEEKQEAMRIVKEKAGLEDKTIEYLDKYEYSRDLFIKLSQAMK